VSSTVWKYPLQVADEQTIYVPSDPRVLHLEMQHQQPCMWLLVDPEKERMKMKIRIIGTGWAPVDTTLWVYLGTYMEQGGRLVWHYFWDRSL
jgi:hypothetical protein